MRGLVAAFVLLGASQALAQGGPSFDCARAESAIDRAICKDADLSKADREMASAYTALLDKLSGSAKEELVKDQVWWVAGRNRGCSGDTDGIVPCLKLQYPARIASLKAMAAGPYPSISTQSLANKGKLGKITWSYDIGYPRFDGKTADFAALNARFAEAARKAAYNATPKADAGPEREQEWTYEQNFTLHRPSPDAVTVGIGFYGYSGGAHGYGATTCTLVDLRTGKAVGPQGVFAPGEQWLRSMSQIVGADLRKQFEQKPGFDDALEPANLAKLLSESGHYCWHADKLELVFNAYEVGPYVSGPFEVEISYGRLKPLMRADGPLSR